MAHTHHLLPRHVIEWNDPLNLIECTIPEHAEHHRYLWETFAYYEDYLAWQGLAGVIGREQVIAESSRYWAGKKFSPAHRAKCSASHLGHRGYWLGKKKPQSRATAEKIRASKKGIYTVSPEGKATTIAKITGRRHSLETKNKMSAAQTGKKDTLEVRANKRAAALKREAWKRALAEG